jgi:predicted Holliday junction resolvase-like endonuclease
MSDVRQRTQKGGSGGSLRKSPSHSKPRGGGAASLIGIGLFIIVVVAVTASYTFFSNFDPSGLQQRKGMRSNNVEQQHEEEDEAVVDRKLYEELKAQNRDLQEQLEKSKEMVDSHIEEGSREELSKLQRMVELLRNYKFRMHDAIKSISKRQLLAKYGEGPHFVEMEVAFDPNSNIYSLGKPTEKLIIELAPVNDMPATVFFFLEQVNATLFDGCSFHRNAGHVVQGGPAPNFLTSRQGEPLIKKFSKAGLVSVPFQEYSPKFPHKKYT